MKAKTKKNEEKLMLYLESINKKPQQSKTREQQLIELFLRKVSDAKRTEQ